MQEGKFKNTLKSISEALKGLENLSSELNSQMRKAVDSLDEESKEKYYKVVKESSDIINNKNMGFAEKITVLNELKNKHGISNDNK
jgi:uncharacterized phage infection (PIP) family protein YhgE